VDSARRRLSYLKNYLEAARRVKELVKSRWPEAETYVFGSVIKGEYTTSSDIDILVILDREPSPDEVADMRANVYMAMPDAPIELHIVSRRKFKNWYARFIDKMIKV